YGAAMGGGNWDAGVIYSYNTNTSVYKDLYDFRISYGDYYQRFVDSGYAPFGSLILASDGKLYGMASGYNAYYQNIHGFGNIYSFNINNNTYTNLHAFGGTKDGFGFGSMIEHNHILYGMTSGKPQYAPQLMDVAFNQHASNFPAVNSGNIFSFDPVSQTYNNLYNFDTVNGLAPYGSLIVGSDDKFYGMASAGGANSSGVIFSFDPISKVYTNLHDFGGLFGAKPMGDLTQSGDYLFGTTSAGGGNGSGVIFRFNPVTRDYIELYNLFDSTGSSPLGGGFALVNTNPTGILTPRANQSMDVYPVPAHNYLTADIENATGEPVLLKITDINGRVVWVPQTKPENGNSKIQLDISSFESGLYFLQACTSDNTIVKKIVKE
ncbi:choice-of-anchor tandem repeat GloVer-containing protein, partial [uncultured Mucilaginibacter sp.]|uniref:choice-of-anchor tandem repeat GloVer-containing protein n=1 Tax=uncultured Mucilaginibacter sp. TaxID=797541 RepID=UPI0025E37C57